MRDRIIAGAIVVAGVIIVALWDFYRWRRGRCRICGAEHAFYPERRCYSCHVAGIVTADEFRGRR